MRALKSLVIGLAILIVVAMGLLAWGMYQKASDPGFAVFKPASPAAGPAVPGSPPMPPRSSPSGRFDDLKVSLPAGCRVLDIHPDGPRLYLHVGPAGACERIVVVDVADGKVLGAIAIETAP